MSHFSVCVVIPHWLVPRNFNETSVEDVLYSILAPYDEGTDNPGYLEFYDETDEATREYQTKTSIMVKYPDGRIISCYDKEFENRFVLHEHTILERFDKEHGGNRETEASRQLELIPDYPVSKRFSFVQYCRDYCGYTATLGGRWGYFSNPNAKWDWFTIGGRFSGRLLAKRHADWVLESADHNSDSDGGNRFTNGAQMKDIDWERMRQLRLESAKAQFGTLSKAFQKKDTSKLAPLAAITEEGIAGWCEMLYYKGETLEDYLKRKGVSSEHPYPIDCYAFVNTNGEWFESGQMGWFGISSNNKPERQWQDEIQVLMKHVIEDDYLVIVDCHI